MGLREQAALDAQSILEDTSGFGSPFTLTSPQGVAVELTGFTTDVGQTIDPDTGQAVAGRRASVAVALRSLPELPVVTADSDRKPWLVRFANLLGVHAAWKAIEVLPDRALGVVVLLLEVYQQAVVVMSSSVLVLPRLLLEGSISPAAALSGALILPSLLLSGALSPAVALSGTLPLPALQLTGALSPAVELGGSLPLPSLQLSGELAPAVALSGALVLPSLQLSGGLSPAVALSGALALPSLLLSGVVSPVVGLTGAVALPSLQLAGSLTPALSLAGTLTLPSLQLAGSLTPAVSLAGSLTLPSLQLAGALTPAVLLAGTLTLPSLQLAGSLTVSASKISGWLRLAASSQSGGEWTPSIVDVLNAGSPMVQTGVNRRAAVGASANSLPTMLFDGSDVHLWPQSPAHSSTTKVGIWFWYKPATVSGVQRLYGVLSGAGGSGSNRLQLYTNGAVLNCEAYASSNIGRFGTTPAALTAGAWHAIYLQYDSSRGGDPNLQIWVNGTSLSLTYGNLGAGATLTVLPAASGSALVGGGTDSDTTVNPIANGGQIGPNVLALNDNLTTTEEAAIRAFEAPT